MNLVLGNEPGMDMQFGKSTLLFFWQLIAKGLFDGSVGVVVFCFFAAPGAIPGWIIDRYVDLPFAHLAYLLGGLSVLICYTVISRDFVSMYQEKSVDEESLKGLPGKMLMLLIGLALATWAILFGLSQWEGTLQLFKGEEDTSAEMIGVFVLDQVFRGAFVDIFEVFELHWSELRHNASNWVFVVFLVVFRIACSALFVAHIFLRYKEFRDPEGWASEYRQDETQSEAKTD